MAGSRLALRRDARHGATGTALAATPVVDEVLRSSGVPLDGRAQRVFGDRFGHDFGHVRVHTDSKAGESARAMRARAYTVGSHVVFGAGRYQPGTERGHRLLLHELAHVVQQRGAVAPGGPLEVEATDSPAERQARVLATKVACGEPAPDVARVTVARVQRDDVAAEAEAEPATESLGPLDSGVADAIGSAAIGSVPWRLLREMLRGVVQGVRSQPERRRRIAARLQAMARSPADLGRFLGGYSVGIALGLWDSLVGLFDLLTLAPRMLYRAFEWVIIEGPRLLRDFDRILAEVQAIQESLREFEARVGAALSRMLRDREGSIAQVREMLQSLLGAAQERVRSAGRDIAERIFEFFEQPAYEFGRSIGRVVGMVLFEVLLALASAGIAAALRTIGAMLARGARLVISAVMRLFRLVGEAARGLASLARALGRTGLRIFAEIGPALGRLMERIAALVRRVLGGIEPAGEAVRAERVAAGPAAGRLTPAAPRAPARPSAPPSAASARGAPAARAELEIEESVERAFAEGQATSGELIELVPYGGATRARQARGLSGRRVEAGHGTPRAAMRGVASYDPDVALTRLLGRDVHLSIDRYWKQEARRLVREGRTTWTAQEMFDTLAQSIRRSPLLSDAEKLSHIARLQDEIFVEMALRRADLVRLPYSR
jgi:hypothetical protein